MDISFDLEELGTEASGEEETDDTETASLGVDPVFVEILQQEVDSHLKEVEHFLSEAKESGSATVTEDLIRTVHTLNGAASSVRPKNPARPQSLKT